MSGFFGFTVDEDVEVRMKDGRAWGPWERAKIVRFDRADRAPWVKLDRGGTYRINNLKMIRPFYVPTDPDEIVRWLEE